MLGFLKKIFDHEYKELNKFKLIANEVFELDEKYKKMTDKQFLNIMQIMVILMHRFLT